MITEEKTFTSDNTVTCGEWQTEAESVAAFDALVEAGGLFRIAREVAGEYLHPRPRTPDRAARVDRLLIPTQKLLAANWSYGAIAVECKRSGEKIGPAIAQAADYQRCTFEGVGGMLITPLWAFIWPLDHVYGNVESIMSQFRIGSVSPGRGGGLTFRVGGTSLLYQGPHPELFKVGNVKCGNKVGRR